jgi:hypothetical protein
LAGTADGELRTFRTTHPIRKGVDSAARGFTHDTFAITMLLSSVNADRDMKERMPPIVHGGGFETVGTM